MSLSTRVSPSSHPSSLAPLPGLQDFYNLVDVYLDAVLHPRCVNDKKTFEQEGWHLELDNPKGAIPLAGSLSFSPPSAFREALRGLARAPFLCCAGQQR